MKKMFAGLLALTLGMTALSTTASADAVQVPEEMTLGGALYNYLWDIPTDAAEFTLLGAQQQYYQILLASFEGSYAMSKAFEDNSAANTATRFAGGGVQIAIDAYLAKAWLSGARPTAAILGEIWQASRGSQGRLSALSQKTWGSLVTLAKQLKIPKNFVSTAVLGTFTWIQIDTIIVINMSEEQYKAEVSNIRSTIASIQMRQAAIADQYARNPVRR